MVLRENDQALDRRKSSRFCNAEPINHFRIDVRDLPARVQIDEQETESMTNPSLERKYQVEIDRLDAEHAELERLWTNVPWFAALIAVAPFAGALWGWGAAVVAMLVTAALVGTRAYLIAVRKSENRWNRERLFDDLHAA
ncbi:MAG: hypothetical protein ABW252_07455 [Polyangiales bacterium]